MLNEYRIHSSHEEAPARLDTVSRRDLPMMCPHCQQPISLSTGLCGNRQIDAILLQAERIGTELECSRCGLRFIYHRTSSVQQQRIFGKPRELSSHAGMPSREIQADRVSSVML